MDHGICVYDGVSSVEWESLKSKLRTNQEATAKELQKVHSTRDFNITPEKVGKTYDAEGKLWQGGFERPVDGIRTFIELADDLIVCTPHLDITKAKQVSTGGKLQQRHNPYPERRSWADNPGRYDCPFYLKWIPRKEGGSLIVLTPNGLSTATRYVLETEILHRVGGEVKEADRRLPKDPFKFLDVINAKKRLGKIDSATLLLLDDEGNALETATRVFREGGTLPSFKGWVRERSADVKRVTLRSVNLTVQLNDPNGKSFDLVVRPEDEEIPIGVQVSQKSELRTDAYQVITDALRALLF